MEAEARTALASLRSLEHHPKLAPIQGQVHDLLDCLEREASATTVNWKNIFAIVMTVLQAIVQVLNPPTPPNP